MIELLLNNENELALLIPFTNLEFKTAFLTKENNQVGIIVETEKDEPLIFGVLDDEHIQSIKHKGYIYIFEVNDKKVIRENKIKITL